MKFIKFPSLLSITLFVASGVYSAAKEALGKEESKQQLEAADDEEELKKGDVANEIM